MPQLFEDSEKQTVAGSLEKKTRIWSPTKLAVRDFLFLFFSDIIWFGLKGSLQIQKCSLGVETKSEECSFFSGPRNRKRAPSGQRKWEKSEISAPFCVPSLGSTVKTWWPDRCLKFWGRESSFLAWISVVPRVWSESPWFLFFLSMLLLLDPVHTSCGKFMAQWGN